jgi:N-acyl-D-aspartate/D-glutamate deacylase
MPELVIRGGSVVDGTGAAPRTADVAIDSGRIVEVGRVATRGDREIDADGLIVTPGFVDVHTHFDGQATWDPILAPSSNHGVTTVAMGNCGVGFAPATQSSHSWLISMLEGVEDIPGTALAEGLTWDWESFPDYLDALGSMRRAIDIAAHVPHAPLRAYVMGTRGADPTEHPTEAEVSRMAALVGEALDAGAIGFATSRTEVHRTSAGDRLGTLRAGARELLAIAGVLAARGGIIQLISDTVQTADAEFAEQEMALIESLARTSGRALSFTVQQSAVAPDRWREVLARIATWRADGLDVTAQVAPRTIGLLLGLEASRTPFFACPSFAETAALPLAARVRALSDPDRRSRVLAEHAALWADPAARVPRQIVGGFDVMHQLADPVDYLLRGESVGHRARALGMEPAALAYDLMLADDGHQLIYLPALNYSYENLDDVREMIASPVTMYGLSDAGAHCGAICDASTTTSYLSVWGRDCDLTQRIPIETIVRELTSSTARHAGWSDRGTLQTGQLADINVIDLARLGCRPPRIAHDLPAGGRRLVQDATGYKWTIKTGVPTFVDGEFTGELPGELLRVKRSN